MTRKQIIALFACMVLGVGVLFSLLALSSMVDEIPRQPFSRNFPTVSITKESEIDLEVNSFYIAGGTANTIYLGNRTGPLHLVQVGLPALDTLHMVVSLKDTKIPDDYRAFRMKVDSPFFFLSHGILPGIFKGTLKSQEASRFLPVNCPYFVEAKPISATLMALKSFDLDTKSNELATLELDSPYFTFKPELLQKQIDGVFCVEGTIHYSKSLQKVIYAYGYRNEFIVMDTALNLLNRYHTIDTFSRVPIKVADVKSKNYSTLASPAAQTNLDSYVFDNFLIIRSPFLAKNDDLSSFRRASVFDLYDINSGAYRYSFYIDHVDGHTPSSIFITPTNLVVVFDHKLILYRHNLFSLSSTT
jgi:hypothetical protein